MASSGKKGKKSKGKTVPLNDFLQESPGILTAPVKKYNWSDEVEDAFGGYESRGKASVVLPTAPRAARNISDDCFPTQPPYIAYISNLPYDLDEEEIALFFSNMNISNMRLPRNDRSGETDKLKGYGYVEFEDRASLIDAVSIIDTNLKGRRIKIEIATSSDGEKRRGGRMDMGRDRPERPEVAMGDWRSGPRTDTSSESRSATGYNRDKDRERDSASDSNRPGAWRDSSDRPSFRDSDRDRDRGHSNRDGGDRDRGFSRDSDRDRGFSRDSDRDRGFNRDSDRDRGFNRDSDRDRGFSRDSDRDRDRDRGFSDRGGRYGDRGGDRFGNRRHGDRDRDRDEFDKDSDFRRGPPRDKDDGPQTDRDQARTRPVLKLAPRTKPLDDHQQQQQQQQQQQGETDDVPAPPATSVPAASIFGAAKPVDTSARERQIEERLAKEKESVATKDNKPKTEEEERVPKKEAWTRKRHDDDPSPERRPSSRGPTSRRNDEKRPGFVSRDKGASRKDEKLPARKDERPVRDNHEKEMPKLKEPEPPNFAASNIYASLEAEDLSD